MIGTGQQASAQDIIRGTAIYAADSGSNDTYAISLPTAPTSYIDGFSVFFKANTANTGACSLNVNGKGAITIKRPDGTDTVTGDIAAGQIVNVVYIGGVFQMVSKTTPAIQPFFQILVYGTNAYAAFCSSPKGNNLYVCGAQGSQYLYSYPRNKGGSFPTKKYTYTGNVSGSGYNYALGSAVEIGNYVYMMAIQSQYGGTFPGSLSCVRVDKNTLANPVGMSASGHIFSSSSPATQLCYTDGTYLYIYKNSTTGWEKWSISGTTLTYVADITSFTGTAAVGSVASDNENLYVLSVSGSIYTLTKYSPDGTSLIESAVVIEASSLFSATGETTVLGLAAAAVGVVYMVVYVKFSTATTDNTGGAYYFIPVSTS